MPTIDNGSSRNLNISAILVGSSGEVFDKKNATQISAMEQPTKENVMRILRNNVNKLAQMKAWHVQEQFERNGHCSWGTDEIDELMYTVNSHLPVFNDEEEFKQFKDQLKKTFLDNVREHLVEVTQALNTKMKEYEKMIGQYEELIIHLDDRTGSQEKPRGNKLRHSEGSEQPGTCQE